ncbi:hypothetical protein V6N11_067838 [Hibiscus sabdariffa]|uniref:DUF4283 domain-containing protein n=1 Tax=Hibiscus sabdariffa TaxID=183260 RepID=A0ABR2SRY5_9ROSI
MVVHSMESDDVLENDIEILEGDVSCDIVDGIISIDFFERVQTLAVKSLDQNIVAKLLRRSIGYATLKNKMYELWKLEQPFKLMDIKNNYFLVTFRCRSNFLRVFTEGLWMVFGPYLTFDTWTIDFSSAKPYSNKTHPRFMPHPCVNLGRALGNENGHEHTLVPPSQDPFGSCMLVEKRQRQSQKKVDVSTTCSTSPINSGPCFNSHLKIPKLNMMVFMVILPILRTPGLVL